MSTPSDEFVQNNNIKFKITYLGCIEVKVSMKELNFDTRSSLSKECIRQLRTKSSPLPQAAALRTLNASPVQPHGVEALLGQKFLTYAYCEVYMHVSTTKIEVKTVQGDKIVSEHEMHNISFASAGELVAADCVAFVAKGTDPSKCYRSDRNCFVFKCDPKPDSRNSAQNVIAIIGKAFDLRFRSSIVEPNRIEPPPHQPNDENNNTANASKTSTSGMQQQQQSAKEQQHLTVREKTVNDLINLNSPTMNPVQIQQQQCSAGVLTGLFADETPNKMNNVESWIKASENENNAATAAQQQAMSDEQMMMQYKWFHRHLSRARAEALLTVDGSFLVRTGEPPANNNNNNNGVSKSNSALINELSSGATAATTNAAESLPQYVLSVNAGGTFKHLLLVDDQGKVRTLDMEFPSIDSFVLHHHENRFPILSPDSHIWLITPVARTGLATSFT